MSNHTNPAPNPDSNPAPLPEFQVVPPAPVPAAKAPPGKLNKEQTAEVEKLEAIIPMCREAGAVAPLTERHVTPEFLALAEGRIAAARAKSTSSANCTVLAKAATLDEDTARAELMKPLRGLQSAARLEYEQTDPVQLERYLIGERIDQSRGMLEQSGQTIISNANTDRPPTVDTDFIVLATAKLTAYSNSQTPQTNERAAAKAERVNRDALVAQIIADRQKIQTAADNAWPYTNPASAGMRLKFRLPPRRPYIA